VNVCLHHDHLVVAIAVQIREPRPALGELTQAQRILRVPLAI
jgi:hypothetical protein